MDDHRQSHFQCPADASGRLLCWDDKHCQKVCPASCGNRSCTANGTCCNAACLGGCDGDQQHHCHVCRHYSVGYGTNRTCTETCPGHMYKLFRRCVTEQECREMPPPPPINYSRMRLEPNIQAYKILNDTCVYMCPNGYMEKGTKDNASCEKCPPSGCTRECTGGTINSAASAEKFRGCTTINGSLIIALRSSGGNIVSILESALSEVRVIYGVLKVVRSYPLVSLMSLKRLEKIVAIPGLHKGEALHIFNNPNLELLWDWEADPPKRLQITGKLFIHFNQKLCYNKQILPLRNMTVGTSFDEVEVSTDNNGDQALCYQETLDLRIQTLHKNFVILTWNTFCIDDTRQLLGYSIYYIAAEHNVTLYGQRDACSDTWNVLDIANDDVRNNTAIVKPGPGFPNDTCDSQQPVFHPVNHLIPFTRYAVYVKTYTTLQDKRGAQSPIKYFVTLPGRPSPPVGLTEESRTEHSVSVRWSPPTMPNGTIIAYHVEVQANSYNRLKIMGANVNYCTNPSLLANIIAVRGEDIAEKKEDKSGEVKNGSCECKEEETRTYTKFDKIKEKERQESITFENELQNMVYVKQKNTTRGSNKNKRESRLRRSIDNSLSSMLVILSANNVPQVGVNHPNFTEENGFISSLYYKLSGDARSLTVNNMRHFTWYTVSVWACRAQHANESDRDYADDWCSERAFYTFRTLELLTVDVVRKVHAEVLPSNKTMPDVNVTWEPPDNPNGFVVAYNVHHLRVEDNAQAQDVGLQSCISATDYENGGRGFLIRNLAAGNYTIRITPITVSGAGNVSSDIYVFIPERTAESGYEWIWGVVGGCLIVILVLGGGIWYARRGLLLPTEANKLFASVNPEYVSTVYVPDEWEVPRSNIECIRELGQGSFGMVYEGIAKGLAKGKPETRCAVKTVNEHATDRERIEFLNEASVMKAFDTFHVVRLLGVVSRGQPTLVVMELMEHGDLKTYLRSHRPDPDASQPRRDAASAPPTLQNILQMAIEIADGMAYLSAKKFVHRDLAARNCMVAGDLTVKVGDFGMTRDIYETDYYRKGSKGLLPVRWMSPESLKDGVFSSSSDIWSFGIVLWEMATLAMQPYQGLSNEQVLRYVVEGGVMERPEHCPDRLYELMRACWEHRQAMRPTFLQLVADLAPSAAPYFRPRSFFHTAQGQEIYQAQRNAREEEQELPEVGVGAVATGSGSNLFGVSGRLASWVRELSSLRSRDDDAAAEPLQPQPQPAALPLKGPNGVPPDRYARDPTSTPC
ncbi:insulin-like receptor isoform X2 [Choristoneura fumiferana]|uniref:insulin-like receptor isoform X2 n=1 Tax=Choristoneura fumiferana TaxID=7141 RepID=UPI003D156769